MKKLIVLSIIASFALADNTVTSLTVDQKNEIFNNTNISNGATISQGQTDIKNGSNVNSVTITQRYGTDAGNSLENTTITGTNSEVYQGLTSVDNSRLEHAELTSQNKLKGVTVTGGKSTIRQANLIIGGESNATGTAGGAGGNMGMGGSGENLEITQTNTLQDTNIENSVIDQGITVINNSADVSKSFKLKQTNTINRASANGRNSVDNSKITQGITTISGGTTQDIIQTIENVIEDIGVDTSNVSQSTMILTDSTVSNINNDVGSDIDDKNKISFVTATNDSNIIQSSIDINASTVNGLYKSDRGGLQENNWIHTVTVTNSDIKQSNFNATNHSDVTNITYKTHESGIDAINLIYNSSAINNSEFYQDVTELNNGELENNTFTRANTLNHVIADNSKVKQFNIQVSNSTLNNSELIQQGLFFNVNTTNANLSQGEVSITD